MLAIDRWRNWRPSDKKFGDSLEREPSKPSEPTFEGFEGSTSEQIQNFSDRPPDAPDAWREDFDHWRAERCVSRPGCEDSQSVSSLLLDFAEWCVAHDAAPPRREPFEALLTEAGHPLKDGMAGGLLLREDWEAHCAFQRAPEASGAPVRTTVGEQRNPG